MDDEELALGDEGQDDDARPDDAGGDDGDQDGAREQIEARARELGWKPKTDWKGDQSRWTDAEVFLERTRPAKLRESVDDLARENRELKRQREAEKADFEARMTRLDKVTQIALKRQRETLLANVKAAQRQAVEAADTEAFDELVQYETRVTKDFDKEEQELAPAPAPRQQQAQVNPTIKSWTDSNPALVHDPVKWNAAVAFFSEAERENPEGDIADHLAHVEARVNEVWPGTVRGRGKANGKDPGGGGPRGPRVEAGGRIATRPGARQEGWADIPPAERRLYEDYIKEGLFKDKAAAAKAHWS